MYAKELLPFIDLLQSYYANAFAHIDEKDWRQIASYASEPLAARDVAVRQAIERLAQAPQSDIENFRFDFNALFIGPGKLLAAPYETVYVSSERVLMRHATLSVREEYLRFGMQVDRKNVEADDHIAYELAFLSTLLKAESPKAQEGFNAFVESHVSKWLPAHVQAIRESTKNEVCLGFADLLEAIGNCCTRVCCACGENTASSDQPAQQEAPRA